MLKPSRLSLLWSFIKTRDTFYWFMLRHYTRWGFTELTYRGIPIILRDDAPEDEMLIRQRDGVWKSFNIKTRRVATLKPIEAKHKKNKGLKK